MSHIWYIFDWSLLQVKFLFWINDILSSWIWAYVSEGNGPVCSRKYETLAVYPDRVGNISITNENCVPKLFGNTVSICHPKIVIENKSRHIPLHICVKMDWLSILNLNPANFHLMQYHVISIDQIFGPNAQHRMGLCKQSRSNRCVPYNATRCVFEFA